MKALTFNINQAATLEEVVANINNEHVVEGALIPLYLEGNIETLEAQGWELHELENTSAVFFHEMFQTLLVVHDGSIEVDWEAMVGQEEADETAEEETQTTINNEENTMNTQTTNVINYQAALGSLEGLEELKATLRADIVFARSQANLEGMEIAEHAKAKITQAAKNLSFYPESDGDLDVSEIFRTFRLYAETMAKADNPTAWNTLAIRLAQFAEQAEKDHKAVAFYIKGLRTLDSDPTGIYTKDVQEWDKLMAESQALVEMCSPKPQTTQSTQPKEEKEMNTQVQIRTPLNIIEDLKKASEVNRGLPVEGVNTTPTLNWSRVVTYVPYLGAYEVSHDPIYVYIANSLRALAEDMLSHPTQFAIDEVTRLVGEFRQEFGSTIESWYKLIQEMKNTQTPEHLPNVPNWMEFEATAASLAEFSSLLARHKASSAQPQPEEEKEEMSKEVINTQEVAHHLPEVTVPEGATVFRKIGHLTEATLGQLRVDIKSLGLNASGITFENAAHLPGLEGMREKLGANRVLVMHKNACQTQAKKIKLPNLDKTKPVTAMLLGKDSYMTINGLTMESLSVYQSNDAMTLDFQGLQTQNAYIVFFFSAVEEAPRMDVSKYASEIQVVTHQAKPLFVLAEEVVQQTQKVEKTEEPKVEAQEQVQPAVPSHGARLMGTLLQQFRGQEGELLCVNLCQKGTQEFGRVYLWKQEELFFGMNVDFGSSDIQEALELNFGEGLEVVSVSVVR